MAANPTKTDRQHLPSDGRTQYPYEVVWPRTTKPDLIEPHYLKPRYFPGLRGKGTVVSTTARMPSARSRVQGAL